MTFWYFEGQAKLSYLVKWMPVQPNYREKCKKWVKRQCKDFNVAMFLVSGVVYKCVAQENIFITLTEGIGNSWGRRESQGPYNKKKGTCINPNWNL